LDVIVGVLIGEGDVELVGTEGHLPAAIRPHFAVGVVIVEIVVVVVVAVVVVVVAVVAVWW